MPNQTIYLSKEQQVDFRAGQQAIRARGETSIGEIVARSLRAYADQSAAVMAAIERAKAGSPESDIEQARR